MKITAEVALALAVALISYELAQLAGFGAFASSAIVFVVVLLCLSAATGRLS